MPSLWVAPFLPRVQPLPFSPATSHSSAKKPLHGPSPSFQERQARPKGETVGAGEIRAM